MGRIPDWKPQLYRPEEVQVGAQGGVPGAAQSSITAVSINVMGEGCLVCLCHPSPGPPSPFSM